MTPPRTQPRRGQHPRPTAFLFTLLLVGCSHSAGPTCQDHPTPVLFQPGKTVYLTEDLVLTKEVLPDHTGIEGSPMVIKGQGHAIHFGQRQQLKEIHYLVFDDCVILGQPESKVTFENCRGIVLRNCRINLARGEQLRWGIIGETEGHRFENNRISGGFILNVTHRTNSLGYLHFIHNTVLGSGGNRLFQVEGERAVRVDNCILVDVGMISREGLGPCPVFGNKNILWESLDGKFCLANSLLENPLLDDRLKIKAGSPAINAGAGQGRALTFDFEGDYRGLRPDIGADEYNESTSD